MPADLERHLALLALLCSSPKPLSFRLIQKKLPSFYPEGNPEALKKKFSRDKDTLNGLGWAVLVEKDAFGEECYRVPEPVPALSRDFALAGSEAAFLREALENPLVTGQIPGMGLRCLANLLCFHAPFDEAEKGEEPGLTKADGWLFKALRAAAENKAIQIDYPSGKAAILETRVVSPWGAYTHNGEAYLVAGCHKDGNAKTFALSRVGKMEFAEAMFLEKPAGFTLEKFAKGSSFRFGQGEPVPARLLVDAAEAWKLEERTPWAIRERRRDGAVIAGFKVTSPEHFYRYVLSFGPRAVILGPKKLRDGLKAMLKGAS